MKTQIEKIEELINCLPKRDRGIAKKYLNERNFMEIFELADSNIKKTHRREVKTGISEDDNIADLVELRDSVIDYAASIALPYEDDYIDIY